MKISMDKKYRTRGGDPVRILCVDRYSRYPVVALVHRKYHQADHFEECVCYRADTDSLVEITRYDGYKKDDKVLVKQSEDSEVRKAFFAGVSPDGRPCVYSRGRPSWNAKSSYPIHSCVKEEDFYKGAKL